MKNRILVPVLTLLFSCFSIICIRGQQPSTAVGSTDLKASPKLVVGIVVDQMRYDYLTRFYDRFGDDGFKRLVEQGFNCKNNHFNYSPTSTGPGHASVYTGATPSAHGVIGNSWYDKESETDVYCAGDDTYTSVGTESGAGQMSPHRMTVTTLTDELRLHTQMRGKTIAVAIKDRGSVLPGGHTANAAYWFHGADEGKWVTSSYYMDELPKWVEKFNASDAAERYKKPWKTVKPIDSYAESGTDSNEYEGLFEGENESAFPHELPKLWDANGQYEMIRATPYGNSLTADFAIEALEQEKLGTDPDTDFLAISFSSTDYVGHRYGVDSKEIEDTYLRLDEDLARIFKALDAKVGQDQYTVFLTADHGAIDVPAYLSEQKIPAGYMEWDSLKPRFEQFLTTKFGSADIVKNFSNYQYFLDHDKIKTLDMPLSEVQEALAVEILSYKGIQYAYTGHQMWNNEYTEGIPNILQNGYHQKRSGDVLIVLSPDYISYPKTGSTHGSPYIYDTHVPLLFYGKGIQKGSTVARTEIPDIAATMSALLGISFPSGTTGRPIVEVLDK